MTTNAKQLAYDKPLNRERFSFSKSFIPAWLVLNCASRIMNRPHSRFTTAFVPACRGYMAFGRIVVPVGTFYQNQNGLPE